MKVAIFDSRSFEKSLFEKLNHSFGFELTYFEVRLTEETVRLAEGYPVVCSFANDRVNAGVLDSLKSSGVKFIALRSAGFNHVDVPAAARCGIKLARVPAYSPYAVAEYAATMLMALNRKICKASARVHDLNFSLDGLVGFDLHGKTVGIIGTGRIGSVLAKIMTGFGCRVLAFDKKPDLKMADALGVKYVSLVELYKQSDVISLHLPLSPTSLHIVGADAIAQMKKGVVLINTGRGGLIDTKALIVALKSGHVGAAALDVYEEEENIFSQDLSQTVLQDDVLARLMTFPNVLITAHQAFLTNEALHGIVETTLLNIKEFAAGQVLTNEVRI